MFGNVKWLVFFGGCFLLLGLGLRAGLNHWVPDIHFEASATKSGKTSGTSRTGHFYRVCMSLEESRLMSPSVASNQFLKETAPSYCFCLSQKLKANSQEYNQFMSFGGLEEIFKSYISSPRGKKVSDYCHQLARVETHRKTGRGLASLPPPPKKKIR